MKKEFVVFLSPGTLFAESSEREIPSRDTKLATEMAKTIKERYNATPYGFRFETRLVHDPIPDGEGGTLTVRDKVVSKTGIHFINGKLETLDDVTRRNDPKERILRDNMMFNDFPIIVTTTNSYKSTNQFNEEDFVVDSDGNIVERGDAPKHVAYRLANKDAWKKR